MWLVLFILGLDLRVDCQRYPLLFLEKDFDKLPWQRKKKKKQKEK
jgi:hypothetical protein